MPLSFQSRTLDHVAMVTPNGKVNPNKAFFFLLPSCHVNTLPMVKSLFVAVYIGPLLQQAPKCACVSVCTEQAAAVATHCLIKRET